MVNNNFQNVICTIATHSGYKFKRVMRLLVRTFQLQLSMTHVITLNNDIHHYCLDICGPCNN